MQSLWAKLLAGEANKPGSFSKRTIELVSTLDKYDAKLFTSLCTFVWVIGGSIPLIYSWTDEIYNQKDINFDTITHLEAIGLIKHSPTGVLKQQCPKSMKVFYYGTPFDIEFPKVENNRFDAGYVLFTKVGLELAPICGSVSSDEFLDYILNLWHSYGYVTSRPWPKQ